MRTSCLHICMWQLWGGRGVQALWWLPLGEHYTVKARSKASVQQAAMQIMQQVQEGQQEQAPSMLLAMQQVLQGITIGQGHAIA